MGGEEPAGEQGVPLVVVGASGLAEVGAKAGEVEGRRGGVDTKDGENVEFGEELREGEVGGGFDPGADGLVEDDAVREGGEVAGEAGGDVREEFGEEGDRERGLFEVGGVAEERGPGGVRGVGDGGAAVDKEVVGWGGEREEVGEFGQVIEGPAGEGGELVQTRIVAS